LPDASSRKLENATAGQSGTPVHTSTIRLSFTSIADHCASPEGSTSRRKDGPSSATKLASGQVMSKGDPLHDVRGMPEEGEASASSDHLRAWRATRDVSDGEYAASASGTRQPLMDPEPAGSPFGARHIMTEARGAEAANSPAGFTDSPLVDARGEPLVPAQRGRMASALAALTSCIPAATPMDAELSFDPAPLGRNPAIAERLGLEASFEDAHLGQSAVGAETAETMCGPTCDEAGANGPPAMGQAARPVAAAVSGFDPQRGTRMQGNAGAQEHGRAQAPGEVVLMGPEVTRSSQDWATAFAGRHALRMQEVCAFQAITPDTPEGLSWLLHMQH
jgi:hypothetical protein